MHKRLELANVKDGMLTMNINECHFKLLVE